MKRILSAYLLVFGTHFLGKWYSRQSADLVEGRVIDVKTTTLSGASRGRTGKTYFDYPIVRYVLDDHAATTREVKGAIYGDDVRVGDTVRIVVPSSEPHMAVPDTFWCYWLRLPKAVMLFFIATLLAPVLYKFGEYVRGLNSPEE